MDSVSAAKRLSLWFGMTSGQFNHGQRDLISAAGWDCLTEF
jgi:hypothetical protein